MMLPVGEVAGVGFMDCCFMLRGCVVGLLSVAGVGTYCSGMCLVGWLVVVAILRCLFGWGFDLQVAVCFGVVSWVLVLVVYFGLVVLSLWVDGCDQLSAGFGVWLFIWVCVSEWFEVWSILW